MKCTVLLLVTAATVISLNHAHSHTPVRPAADPSGPRLVVGASPTTTASPAARVPAFDQPHSLADVIATAMPSVVTIQTEAEGPRLRPANWGSQDEGRPGQDDDGQPVGGLGSGVIFSANGYILTNYHVVRDARRVQVIFHSPERKMDATVVGGDADSDIAVIKVNAKDLTAADLGDSDHLRVGDLVIAIGSPFGLVQSATTGIVSALGRANLHITGYEDFIQTDASINPGNSGGALLDAGGRVIGINTAIYSRSGGNVGIGFAIPVRMAMAAAHQIIETGHVVRGFLGVEVEDAPDDSGARVRHLSQDSPAAKAGLKEGDIITSVSGRKVKDSTTLRLAVSEAQPGVQTTVSVLRQGKVVTLTPTPAQKPESVRDGNPGPDDRRHGNGRRFEPRGQDDFGGSGRPEDDGEDTPRFRQFHRGSPDEGNGLRRQTF